MQGMQFDSWIRKFLGEGNGVPLQCSCLRNPKDRGAWGATGHGVAKTQKRLPSVQFSSVAQSCQTLCDPMDCSMSGFPVHHQLPEVKLMSIESVMPSNHLILCHPLLLLPSIFPNIRVFLSESGFLHQVAKVLEFQLQHQSFQ